MSRGIKDNWSLEIHSQTFFVGSNLVKETYYSQLFASKLLN